MIAIKAFFLEGTWGGGGEPTVDLIAPYPSLAMTGEGT